MSFIQSKLDKIKTQGFTRTFEIQFNRFVPPWVFRYSKGDIYDLDIEKLKALDPESATKTQNGLTSACLDGSYDTGKRQQLREFTWNSVPLETTRHDLGYAIYDSDEPSKLLGGLWAAVDSFSEHNLGIQFNFSKHQAWLYCAFVHKDARGRGVYKKLISFAANDLQKRGFTQLLGIVQPWNKISRMMHEKQSRGIVGQMSAVRIGPLVKVSNSGDIAIDKNMVTNPSKSPAVVSIATPWNTAISSPF